ncbi:MAG TPA: hypothetical protein VH087_02715 [Thermoanaerobaculia bacterium]|jgi:hypothetical protein|nr:hypothetical protein [Thermoanaerobaculia bacterium]
MRLRDAAASLNAASDEFSKTIAPIDAALKKLNLGVTAWHSYLERSPDENGDYWSRDIGYARVQGKWGLALRTVSGNANYGDDDTQEWLFNDAPRFMRAEAIDNIPALLEVLIRQAEKVAGDLRQKSGHARMLASAISIFADGQDARK